MITATGITQPGIRNHKPYRWHGIPGWNPARSKQISHERDIAVACPQCGTRAGQNCRTSGGRVYQDYEASHAARRSAS